MLVSPQHNVLLKVGDETETLVRRLGIAKPVRSEGETIAVLYYYDPEVAYLAKIKIGIPISVFFLLAASALLFVALALLVAYWLSGRLTAPLNRLIPVINRLGRGELGIQAS